MILVNYFIMDTISHLDQETSIAIVQAFWQSAIGCPKIELKSIMDTDKGIDYIAILFFIDSTQEIDIYHHLDSSWYNPSSPVVRIGMNKLFNIFENQGHPYKVLFLLVAKIKKRIRDLDKIYWIQHWSPIESWFYLNLNSSDRDEYFLLYLRLYQIKLMLFDKLIEEKNMKTLKN